MLSCIKNKLMLKCFRENISLRHESFFIMAVEINNQGDKELLLSYTNGDLEKLNQIMKKWAFKDYQSFSRFAMSLFLLNEDNFFGVTNDGVPKSMEPLPEFLK